MRRPRLLTTHYPCRTERPIACRGNDDDDDEEEGRGRDAADEHEVRLALAGFGVLDGALAPPVVAVARRDKPTAEFPDGSVAFGLQFTDAVSAEIKDRLTLDAPLTRIALAPAAPAAPAK